MRRFSIVLLLALTLIFATAATAAAQDQTAEPAAPLVGQSVELLATQVFLNADRAEGAADDAKRYAEDATTQVTTQLDTANNLLSLFESVTAISGLLIPLLAVVAGVLGINRLNSAQRELEEARERFERDMQEKQAELITVRQELEQSAALQRENAARANLALSLLPLGERQYRAQDYNGAISAYLRALELHTDSVVTHYRLGYVYTQSGNLEKAQEHLSLALNIERDFAPALACLGYVKRRVAEKLPDGIERDLLLNEAESLLLKALAISPKLIDDDGEAWWGSLGGLYRRRNQIDAAINAYEKASQATPHSSYAFSNLALLYVQKRDVDAMMRTYERVEQLARAEVQSAIDNYWAYADLLTARLALGKSEEAEEVLISVFRTAPADSPYVFESLLDTLRRLELALGEKRSAHLRPFLERIEEHIASRNGSQAAHD